MPPAKLIDPAPLTTTELVTALLPWIILCAILLIWGTGWFKAWADSTFIYKYPVPGLDQMINKVAPVAANRRRKGRCLRSPICRSPAPAC
jgi:lactate permease